MRTIISDTYEELQPKIYAFFYIKTNNKEISEDLTQEVFYEALKAYSSFKNKSSIKTWMFAIANNILKKHYRKTRNYNQLNNRLTHNSTSYNNLEDSIIKKDEKVNLIQIINKLESAYREIVILRVYGELSFSEIGEIINKSENYARVYFHRAKLKIQKGLEVHNG